ncbi:hypothetical protein ACVWXL_008152 [Bradyrhizobium sp. GM22.5]
MKQMRDSSGRSATASTSRTGRFSFSATAIGHSACGSGAVGKIELPGHAPHVADARRASGELDAGAVEEGDAPLGVGRVDRGGQGLQQLAELLLSRRRVLAALSDGGMPRDDGADSGLVGVSRPIQHRSLSRGPRECSGCRCMRGMRDGREPGMCQRPRARERVPARSPTRRGAGREARPEPLGSGPRSPTSVVRLHGEAMTAG